MAQKGLTIKNYSFFIEDNKMIEPGDKFKVPVFIFFKEKEYRILMTNS